MRAYDGGGSLNFIYQDGLGADSVERSSQEVSHQKNKKAIRDECFQLSLALRKFRMDAKKIKGHSLFFKKRVYLPAFCWRW